MASKIFASEAGAYPTEKHTAQPLKGRLRLEKSHIFVERVNGA